MVKSIPLVEGFKVETKNDLVELFPAVTALSNLSVADLSQ